MKLSSPTFADGAVIPRQHGYKNGNAVVPITVSDIPADTVSLALIMDDPDAMVPAGKVWVHWLLWNISPDTTDIDSDDLPGVVRGMTDFDHTGYGGPAPPDKQHTYIFRMYALDTNLNLSTRSIKQDLEKAMAGHILETATLRGTYAP